MCLCGEKSLENYRTRRVYVLAIFLADQSGSTTIRRRDQNGHVVWARDAVMHVLFRPR